MAQAVICQPLTTEAPYDIWRATSGSGKTFPSVFLFSTNVACLWLVPKDKRKNTGDVSENNTCSEIGEHCFESTCFHRFFRQVTEHQTMFPFTFKWPSVRFITTWPVLLGPVKCHRFLGVAARQAQPAVNSAVGRPQRLSGTVRALQS
jgi:hypothetical protein